jgi:hypothetical protein
MTPGRCPLSLGSIASRLRNWRRSCQWASDHGPHISHYAHAHTRALRHRSLKGTSFVGTPTGLHPPANLLQPTGMASSLPSQVPSSGTNGNLKIKPEGLTIPQQFPLPAANLKSTTFLGEVVVWCLRLSSLRLLRGEPLVTSSGKLSEEWFIPPYGPLHSHCESPAGS